MSKKRFFLVLNIFSLLVVIFLFSTVSAQYLNSTNFQLENPINIFEGGIMTSSSFQYISGSGQIDTGESTSTSFLSRAGSLYYPIATTPVIATSSSSGAVNVTWTASVGTLANVTSYETGIATNIAGPFTYVDVGNVLTKNYTGLTNGTTYYFKVKSYAAGVLLNESAIVSGLPTSGVGTGTTGDGGGGGGGGATFVPPSSGGIGSVNFSGRAFPMSKIFILKDGVLSVSTVSDPQANFSVNVSGINSGSYNFSIYGQDSNGKKSSSFSFPITINDAAAINIGGIFLAPTIDVDKSEVRKGENVAIFGQSVPSSDITISVHSENEFFNKIKTDKNGVYLLNFDTTPLELGGHTAKSKSAVSTEISPFGNSVGFKVGLDSVKKEIKNCSALRGDLNCDSKVNLVDFSIMAYWYKKINPPANVDLNSDGKITLVDFSIMAFNWTG